MADTLIVIEAPGKVKLLSKILAELSISGQVIATRGSLYDMPIDQLGLDPSNLKPTKWVAISEGTIRFLSQRFRDAKKVFIMTDADRAGELIAAQVVTLLRKNNSTAEVLRITASALNTESVRHAFSAPRNIDRDVCLTMMATRAIDRAIGYLCSDRSIHQTAGRISSKIAQAINERPLSRWRLMGSHPSEPGWRISAKGPDSKKASLHALEKAFKNFDERLMQPAPVRNLTKPPPPLLTGGDTLLFVAGQLDIPLDEAEKLIQSAYERGAISYPRTDSQEITLQTRTMLEGAMRQLGKRVRPFNMPLGAPVKPASAHEAVYPASPQLFYSPSLVGLSKHDAVPNMIARRTFASLSPDAKVKSLTVPQEVISAFLQSNSLPDLDVRIWKDVPETVGWLAFERDFVRPAEVSAVDLDHAILERLIEKNIGRPSTVVGHITNALKRRWVSSAGVLSDKGKSALTYLRDSFPGLLNGKDLEKFFVGRHFPTITSAIEAGLGEMQMSYQDLIEAAKVATAEKKVAVTYQADESSLPVYNEDAELYVSSADAR